MFYLKIAAAEINAVGRKATIQKWFSRYYNRNFKVESLIRSPYRI